MRPGSRLLAAALLSPTVLLLAACGQGADAQPTPVADGRPAVVTAFAPLTEAALAVGGDAIDVTTLTPPGAEPHDLELSAAQVAQLSEADLVLYVKGFQPAVDEAVAQHAADRAIDVSEGLELRTADEHAHDHGSEDDHGHGDEAAGEGTDPHVWLDPRNMAAMGATIADRLAALAPDAGVPARATAFADAMAALDADYRAALAECASRTMVVSHEAFGYLADAYGLEQVGISGITPDAEPSPARLAEVADVVRTSGVTTIYAETLMDPRVAQTLADEVGVQTAVLDPIESIGEGSTYETIMRANLDALIKGQRCA